MDYKTLKKLLFKFDPETAHGLAEFALKNGGNFDFILNLISKNFSYQNEALKQNIFGLNFANPLGIGGGFDKNATMIKALNALGFGYLEYGTFTPKPQPGNAKPRLFRLIEEESLQNAMGFNNEGSEIIAKRVEKIYPFKAPLIANIGKNKITPNEDALKDYEILTQKFKDLCDIFVINISSPNTPNLRDLQDEKFIKDIFETMKSITTKPILLKIAPDMSFGKAIDLCSCAVQNGANGVIINNTSIDYSLTPNAKDFGGLSGKLITKKTKELFKAVANELFGETILISCGGIDNGKEAYERIKMGASLVEIYTSFIFKGPSVIKNINSQIAELLEKDGFTNITQAIGVNAKKAI
ncbi:quinone-dependent dihydroorotate dehydrogenase [Campylobacter sp. CN_NA1]|uniref:quinone-dependent dihydroorotate dehydrogenase n=1 Tax=Campylobacter sp. CN_NA1 TaxID=2984150 RepID=UPI0022EA0DA0|nr:quinone-dependent dihydroorotate dehydrogenase [Campylobacter sp. CN_NA1]MDA3056727.1 quinone-dependent dihydroorotate dehydrogenase [Campylobacter sp. CN_NA1]